MKPIILKAVTGSIFLLVVASALYFFTRTIFVYQDRSKAAIPENSIGSLSAGGAYTCASTTGGTGYCWGQPLYGQASIPAAVNSDFKKIVAGETHTCGLKNDGSIACWGNVGLSNDPAVFPPTSGINATDIAVGSAYTCAVINGGVRCWGSNGFGQTTVPSTATSGVTQISAGPYDICALKNGGVICWGSDDYRQSTVPSTATSGVTQVSMGDYHACALKNGGVICWGRNDYSQTAVPTTMTSGVTQVSAGGEHTCALKNGAVTCWGYNGRYLAGGPDGRTTPPASASSGVSYISAGWNNTCAIDDNGYTVVCWGNNGAGQNVVPDPLDGDGGGGGPTNTPTQSPTPTPVGVGDPCTVTDQCARGLICREQDDEVSTCQQGKVPPEVCNDEEPLMLCGKDYYCADKNAEGNGVCKFKVCEPGGSLVGCVTATPTPTASKTPTPTPHSGEVAPVCTNHANCGTRPYYLLVERKDQENKPIYDLRYFDSNSELPSDAIYSVVSNGIVVEPPTVIASGEFLETPSPLSRYATIPFQYLFRVKVQDNTTAKNMRIYVGSANMTAPPWTIKTEEQGSVTYKVFLRPGLTEVITSTPTRTPTATPTPEGFNLYLDPAGTDPEKDAVELRLETGVRQGARRGERFSMRIVASPKNTNLRSEFIFLKEVKIPVQYALPVNPNSIILESIKTTNNVQCVDYRLDDPQEDEIGTVSAFYLRAVFKNNTPKQLAADTCIAEFTFDVKDNAQYNDSATVKLLTDEESEGIGEVDIVPALKGMYALAYHLERNAPTTTPAVTPATIHPKVNLSYDDANRSKTVRVDTSRSVAANAADLIVQSVDLIRVEAVTPTACGPVNIRVVVKNQGQSAADPFSISVNGQKKASTQSEPSVSNGGLGVGGTKTYHFDRIKFNADGPNTIFVDSEDKVIEFREDNNYINKKFVFADIPGNTNTQCPNPTNTPTNTPTPTSLTPTPTYIPDPNKINLVMTVKLQGVNQGTFSNQYSRLKFGVAVGGGNLTANTEYIYNDFVHKGDGKYEGVISFDPAKVAVGSGYRIIVKGPKHLAKRFCVAAPTGGYAYFCPANTANISLRKGINNFDFTNVQLIAGDIPNGEQDGVVDSSDLAFIRDNLGIKLPEIIKIGDLNLDGIIDTQDYSMVINNLVNNEDEN